MLARFAVWAVALPLALLPLKLQDWLGAALGAAMLRALRRRREVARTNLALAFPQLDDDALDARVAAHFRHLGCLIVDTLQLPTMALGPLRDRKVTVTGLDHLQAALAEGQSAILLCAHLGNWEVGARVACEPGVELLSVYKAPRSGAQDALLLALRAGFPQHLIEKHGAMRELVKGTRRGALLGLIADQGGLEEYDFLGRPARFPEGPGHFAARYGCPAVPCFAVRLPDGRYRVECLPPLDAVPRSQGKDPEARRRVMRDYIALLEEWIHRHPDQYYWVHDIWRTFKDD